MMFLTRGATYPGLPPEFAYPAAFGDLLTAILAFAANPLLLRGSRAAKPAVWVFNIFGTVDLLVAITTATIYNAPVAMGQANGFPPFWGRFFWGSIYFLSFVFFHGRGRFYECQADHKGRYIL